MVRGEVGVCGSNGPLINVWMGEVQINELSHQETVENKMDPSLGQELYVALQDETEGHYEKLEAVLTSHLLR